MSQITVSNQENYIVLKLSGQFIGGEETDTLRDEIKNLTEQNSKKIIIDLEKVTYLNSLALGALISGHANIARKNGKLVICNVSGNLNNIFTITKLYMVLHIVKTTEDAIKFWLKKF